MAEATLYVKLKRLARPVVRRFWTDLRHDRRFLARLEPPEPFLWVAYDCGSLIWAPWCLLRFPIGQGPTVGGLSARGEGGWSARKACEVLDTWRSMSSGGQLYLGEVERQEPGGRSYGRLRPVSWALAREYLETPRAALQPVAAGRAA